MAFPNFQHLDYAKQIHSCNQFDLILATIRILAIYVIYRVATSLLEENAFLDL